MGSSIWFRVHAIILLLAVIVMMISSQAIAQSDMKYLPISQCTASSQLTADFPASNACDKNDGTRWISGNDVGSTIWIRVNLTQVFHVDEIRIVWGDDASSIGGLYAPGHTDRQFTVYLWVGGEWNRSLTFTRNNVINSVQYFQLRYPANTQSVMLKTGVPLPAPAYVDSYEVSPFGYEARSPNQISIGGSTLLILFFLGMLWLGFPLAGAASKNGFFIIFGGVAGLAFAITAWTTTGDILSSTLLFAAAISTVAYSIQLVIRERGPKE